MKLKQFIINKIESFISKKFIDMISKKYSDQLLYITVVDKNNRLNCKNISINNKEKMDRWENNLKNEIFNNN